MNALDPTYADRPWLRLLNPRLTSVGEPPPTMLHALRATVERFPERVALRYFDAAITYRELDRLTDGLAGRLIADRLRPGDRLVLVAENIPHFVIALYGAWKAGAVVVPVNPLHKGPEIRHLLTETAAAAVVCHEEAWHGYIRTAAAAAGVRKAYTCCPLDFRTGDDPEGRGGVRRRPADDAADLLTCAREAPDAAALPSAPTARDTALIGYTSGVADDPRGALTTHGNIVRSAHGRRCARSPGDGAGVLLLAPLYTAAGLADHLSAAVMDGSPVILTHRFEPASALEALRDHRPARTVGTPDVFTAMLRVSGILPGDFASCERVDCDGGSLPPVVAEDFHNRFDVHLINGYGTTETTGTVTCVPPGLRAPVDPVSGALSVGLPVPHAMIRILDDFGHEVPFGEPGEIAVRGPMVIPGYWSRPEVPQAALANAELRTGDIGFMDPSGWIYLIDRKQDRIHVSGATVWPREVEDVLLTHPDVREAAVVSAADHRGGETVAAYVSLVPGGTADAEALLTFARERLVPFRRPRSVTVLSELPKTADGKLLRRCLRYTGISADQDDGIDA